jgi:predicted permease
VDAWRGRRLRNTLVIGELALATMLLVGAGLLIDSFRRLDGVETGFDTDNVLVIPVTLDGARYPTCEGNSARANCDPGDGDAARVRFVTDAVARLESMSGVRAAGMTSITPLSGSSTSQPIDVEGRVVRSPTDRTAAAWRLVTSGFFRAAGIEIIEGRNFDAIEDRGERRVMIVSAAAARAWWPNQSAVGKRIGFGGNRTRLWEVVGVAADVRDTELASEPQPTVYPPFGGWWPYVTLVVRVAGDPSQMVGAVRRAIHDVDPGLPLPVIRTLDAWRGDAMASARFSTLLMTVFALAALMLAVLGVYGVTVFSVSRRTREIGLRMALGARGSRVVAAVLVQGATLTVAGIVLGTAGALAFSRFMQALLFGTTPVDAGVYASVAALLGIVATLSCLVPAARAARVDPKIALGTD